MKKIMFNDKYGLTKAVLDKIKTQTRRIIKAKNLFDTDEIEDYTVFGNEVQIIANNGESLITIKSKYEVGEVVAVAQSYKSIDDFYKAAFSYNHSVHGMTICEFDGISDDDVRKWNMVAVNYRGKRIWTNKLYVKPELMVHFIRITNIRIEKLQDISDEDCLAEGIYPYYYGDEEEKKRYGIPPNGYSFGGWDFHYPTPREAYAELIDKVGKKGDWQSNPYVFVYDFELVK